MTNDSDETHSERRRYRRWRKDEAEARPSSDIPAAEGRLDLDALRSARAAEGLDAPILHDEYEDYVHDHDGGLRNPYILAGLAVGAAIALAVFVVILFGGGSNAGGPGTTGDPSLVIDPLTPQAGANVRGLSARTIVASTVRDGPGTDFAQIAPLPSGQEVEVIGRNGDSTWFQIYYPQGSQLKGWVPGTALRLSTESIASLAVVSSTPIPRATIVPPTEPPAPQVTATPIPSPLPTGTATPPGGGVDIAVAFQNPSCIPGTSLAVILRNAGTAELKRSVQVTIANAAGVISSQSLPVDLAPGASMTLLTGVQAQAPRMTATVSLLAPGGPDGNPGNNTTECTSGPAPGPVTPGVPATIVPAGPTPRPLPTLVPSVTPRIPGG